jgi:hypothetical protein
MKYHSVWVSKVDGTVEWYYYDGILVIDGRDGKMKWFNDKGLSKSTHLARHNGRLDVPAAQLDTFNKFWLKLL